MQIIANMDEDDINFNGYSFIHDIGVIPEKTAVPTAPNMSDITESVPSMYGNVYEGTNYEGRTFTFKVWQRVGHNNDTLRDIQVRMAQYLTNYDPDDPTKEHALVFGNMNDRFWMGRFTSIGTPSFINTGNGDRTRDFEIELTFECSDPRGFLPPQEIHKTGSEFTIDNSSATAFTDWDIQITVPQSLKHLGVVVNGVDFLAIGDDRDEVMTQGLVEEWQEILPDSNDETSGSFVNWTRNPSTGGNWAWGTSKSPVVGGQNVISRSGKSIAVGTKSKKGYNFNTKKTATMKVMNYGTNAQEATAIDGKPNGTPWYGPVLQTQGFTVGDLKNFKVIFRIKHTKYKGVHNGRAMGDIEVLFMDANDKAFFRSGIKDPASGYAPEFHLDVGTPGTNWINSGSFKTVYTSGSKGPGYKNGTDLRRGVKVAYDTKKVKKAVKTTSKSSRGKTNSKKASSSVKKKTATKAKSKSVKAKTSIKKKAVKKKKKK